MNAGLLQKAAEMRNDESVLIHIRERDCVAIEAKYHKKCYQKYTKSLSNMTREKAETGPVVYDKVFDLFCADIVRKRIIDNKEILLLSCLLKRFISYIRVDGFDVPSCVAEETNTDMVSASCLSFFRDKE